MIYSNFLLLLYFLVDFLMLTDLCSKIRFTHIDFRKSSKKILKLHKWYDGVEKKKSMWSILPNLNSLELKKGLYIHTTIIMNTKSISFTVEFFFRLSFDFDSFISVNITIREWKRSSISMNWSSFYLCICVYWIYSIKQHVCLYFDNNNNNSQLSCIQYSLLTAVFKHFCYT